MIDAVAKALAHWAVPFNEWDGLTDEQRERWRDAARVAIQAQAPASPEPQPPVDVGGTSSYGWDWPWRKRKSALNPR